MPPVTRTSFDSILWPPDVVQWLTNELLTGTAFARALTEFPTAAASVAFPKVAPDAAQWTAEGAPIATSNLNDSADLVSIASLKTLVSVTNEAIEDTGYPLSQQIGRALAESCGPTVDRGLLYGQGAPAPVGVVGKATPAADAPDFRAACLAAWGELVAAGATPSTVRVFAHPIPIADEWSRTSSTGEPLHGDQSSATPLSLGPGITVVPTPSMKESDVLAVDTSAVYFIVRDQLTLELNDRSETAWTTDSTSIRVRIRVAVGAPVPAKSLRTCTIVEGA